MRIGHGYDVHELISEAEFKKRYPNREIKGLFIGGVKIEHNKLLAGHSDADVLIHAIIDALLGAAALNDIGSHFPDNDPQHEGISSLKLLESSLEKIKEKNFTIVNIDATVMAQKPKLRPHIDSMREVLAKTLEIEIEQINIKATTTEGLGFVGREEGIAAQAVCLIQVL